jgi:hypothetical protein
MKRSAGVRRAYANRFRRHERATRSRRDGRVKGGAFETMSWLIVSPG